MATAPNQGIMALPESQGAQAPSLSLSDSYDAMQQGLMQARPDAYMDVQDELAKIRPALEELTDEQLTLLIQALQDLYNDPQNYAAKVQELVKNRFIETADELPPEYDEEFIATLLMVLVDIQRSRQGMAAPMPQMGGGMPAGMMPPPQQFARGGIAEAARMLASKGRNGDTMLAHITPEEAQFLRARGGSGTINPQTGLPEFWPLLSTKRGIGKVISKALSSPLGRILGTIALGMVLGPAVGSIMSGFSTAAVAATTSALSSGLVTAAATGGDLKASLTSAAIGFVTAAGGPVSNYVGKYTGQFLTNEAVRQAANAAIIGTGVGVVSGQNFKEAVKSGLTAGVIAGSTALFSGANKTQADEAAKTAAADAATSGPKLNPLGELDDSQAYIDKYGKTFEPTSGTAAQSAGRYVLGPDGRTFIDRWTSQAVSPTEAAALGLDSNAIPKPSMGSGVTNAQAASNAIAPSAPISSQINTPAVTTPGGEGTFYGARLPGSSVGSQLNAMPSSVAPRLEEGIDIPYKGTGVEPYPKGGYTVGESFGQMGAGAKNFMKGNFSEGAGQLYEGASNLLAPGPSNAQISEYAKANNMTFEQASKEISPGFMRSYGPATAAGIGTLALSGGFSAPNNEPNPLKNKLYGTPGLDLINANPSQYLVQGLPGVSYNQQGNIMGSQAYGSPFTMSNIRVPTMYADGGIAALMQGGYPRKVGQIEGPGTEKSDSIPAMLSDGEFVMTASAVRGAGGGNRREGAKRMYALMHQLERNAARG